MAAVETAAKHYGFVDYQYVIAGMTSSSADTKRTLIDQVFESIHHIAAYDACVLERFRSTKLQSTGHD